MRKEIKVSFLSLYSGRVDIVAAKSENVPRSIFSKEDTIIKINGKEVKKSSKVNENDQVELIYFEECFEGLKAEKIPLKIIYEDDEILVIDKEQGMVVHPGSGVHSGTIVNSLLDMYGEDFNSGFNEMRPGIVHRLDKDTSGVMVIAKTKDALFRLSEEFNKRETKKVYIAIVKGNFIEKEGMIEKRILRDKVDRKKFTVTDSSTLGRDAKTSYKVLSESNGYTLLEIKIYTGRTHQIRVHMKSINHPILGDSIYSHKDKNFPNFTLMLNSYKLTLFHPKTGEKMSFHSEIPLRFKEAFELLKIENTENILKS